MHCTALYWCLPILASYCIFLIVCVRVSVWLTTQCLTVTVTVTVAATVCLHAYIGSTVFAFNLYLNLIYLYLTLFYFNLIYNYIYFKQELARYCVLFLDYWNHPPNGTGKSGSDPNQYFFYIATSIKGGGVGGWDGRITPCLAVCSGQIRPAP